jgi:hypothetical protein
VVKVEKQKKDYVKVVDKIMEEKIKFIAVEIARMKERECENSGEIWFEKFLSLEKEDRHSFHHPKVIGTDFGYNIKNKKR